MEVFDELMYKSATFVKSNPSHYRYQHDPYQVTYCKFKKALDIVKIVNDSWEVEHLKNRHRSSKVYPDDFFMRAGWRKSYSRILPVPDKGSGSSNNQFMLSKKGFMALRSSFAKIFGSEWKKIEPEILKMYDKIVEDSDNEAKLLQEKIKFFDSEKVKAQ